MNWLFSYLQGASTGAVRDTLPAKSKPTKASFGSTSPFHAASGKDEFVSSELASTPVAEKPELEEVEQSELEPIEETEVKEESEPTFKGSETVQQESQPEEKPVEAAAPETTESEPINESSSEPVQQGSQPEEKPVETSQPETSEIEKSGEKISTETSTDSGEVEEARTSEKLFNSEPTQIPTDLEKKTGRFTPIEAAGLPDKKGVKTETGFQVSPNEMEQWKKLEDDRIQAQKDFDTNLAKTPGNGAQLKVNLNKAEENTRNAQSSIWANASKNSPLGAKRDQMQKENQLAASKLGEKDYTYFSTGDLLRVTDNHKKLTEIGNIERQELDKLKRDVSKEAYVKIQAKQGGLTQNQVNGFKASQKPTTDKPGEDWPWVKVAGPLLKEKQFLEGIANRTPAQNNRLNELAYDQYYKVEREIAGKTDTPKWDSKQVKAFERDINVSRLNGQPILGSQVLDYFDQRGEQPLLANTKADTGELIELARRDRAGLPLDSNQLNRMNELIGRVIPISNAKDITGSQISDIQLPKDLKGYDARGTDFNGVKTVPYADLSGIKLSGKDGANSASIQTSDLSKANLEDAKAEKVFVNASDLSKANLNKGDWWRSAFINNDLQFASAFKTNFSDSYFQGVDISGLNVDPNTDKKLDAQTNFSGSHWEDVVGVKANFSDSTLPKTIIRSDLSGADLTKAKMDGIIIDASNFNGTEFNGTKINGGLINGSSFEGANFSAKPNDAKMPMQDNRFFNSNFKNAQFKNVDLTRSWLANSDLRGAKFDKDSNLTQTSFARGSRADHLQGAEFNGSKMHFADLTRANATGAKFNNSDLTGASLTDGLYDNAEFHGTTLKAVNAQGADLSKIKYDDKTDFTGMVVDRDTKLPNIIEKDFKTREAYLEARQKFIQDKKLLQAEQVLPAMFAKEAEEKVSLLQKYYDGIQEKMGWITNAANKYQNNTAKNVRDNLEKLMPNGMPEILAKTPLVKDFFKREEDMTPEEKKSFNATFSQNGSVQVNKKLEDVKAKLDLVKKYAGVGEGNTFDPDNLEKFNKAYFDLFNMYPGQNAGNSDLSFSNQLEREKINPELHKSKWEGAISPGFEKFLNTAGGYGIQGHLMKGSPFYNAVDSVRNFVNDKDEIADHVATGLSVATSAAVAVAVPGGILMSPLVAGGTYTAAKATNGKGDGTAYSGDEAFDMFKHRVGVEGVMLPLNMVTAGLGSKLLGVSNMVVQPVGGRMLMRFGQTPVGQVALHEAGNIAVRDPLAMVARGTIAEPLVGELMQGNSLTEALGNVAGSMNASDIADAAKHGFNLRLTAEGRAQIVVPGQIGTKAGKAFKQWSNPQAPASLKPDETAKASKDNGTDPVKLTDKELTVSGEKDPTQKISFESPSKLPSAKDEAKPNSEETAPPSREELRVRRLNALEQRQINRTNNDPALSLNSSGEDAGITRSRWDEQVSKLMQSDDPKDNIRARRLIASHLKAQITRWGLPENLITPEMIEFMESTYVKNGVTKINSDGTYDQKYPLIEIRRGVPRPSEVAAHEADHYVRNIWSKVLYEADPQAFAQHVREGVVSNWGRGGTRDKGVPQRLAFPENLEHVRQNFSNILNDVLSQDRLSLMEQGQLINERGMKYLESLSPEDRNTLRRFIDSESVLRDLRLEAHFYREVLHDSSPQPEPLGSDGQPITLNPNVRPFIQQKAAEIRALRESNPDAYNNYYKKFVSPLAKDLSSRRASGTLEYWGDDSEVMARNTQFSELIRQRFEPLVSRRRVIQEEIRNAPEARRQEVANQYAAELRSISEQIQKIAPEAKPDILKIQGNTLMRELAEIPAPRQTLENPDVDRLTKAMLANGGVMGEQSSPAFMQQFENFAKDLTAFGKYLQQARRSMDPSDPRYEELQTKYEYVKRLADLSRERANDPLRFINTNRGREFASLYRNVTYMMRQPRLRVQTPQPASIATPVSIPTPPVPAPKPTRPELPPPRRVIRD